MHFRMCIKTWLYVHSTYTYTCLEGWAGVDMCVDVYYYFKNKTRNVNWKSVAETHKAPK